MEAEDIQRIRQQDVHQHIRDKQQLIGSTITKICDELGMIRNAVIHARDLDGGTEEKFDHILNRLDNIKKCL